MIEKALSEVENYFTDVLLNVKLAYINLSRNYFAPITSYAILWGDITGTQLNWFLKTTLTEFMRNNLQSKNLLGLLFFCIFYDIIKKSRLENRFLKVSLPVLLLLNVWMLALLEVLEWVRGTKFFRKYLNMFTTKLRNSFYSRGRDNFCFCQIERESGLATVPRRRVSLLVPGMTKKTVAAFGLGLKFYARL